MLIDNHGFSSIGGLSESVGCQGFGTRYRFRQNATGQMDGNVIPIDFAANAASYGACAICVSNIRDFESALQEAKRQTRTTVIVIQSNPDVRVPEYESWWDVPVAAISGVETVREARKRYETGRAKQRLFL